MKPVEYAYIILIIGVIVGTIGYITEFTGHGTLIPPSGGGWLEVIGFVLVISAGIYLTTRRAR